MDCTIVITGHKGCNKKYLQEAIASTDGLDCRIIVAIDEDLHGLAWNFNRIIRKIETKWVKILAFDDILIQKSFKNQLNLAIKTEADVVYGDYIAFGDQEYEYKTPNFPVKTLIYDRKISAGTALINVEKLRKAGYLDVNFKIAEFYILWLKFIKLNFLNFVHHPEPIIKYRIHSEQKSKRVTKEEKLYREMEMKKINEKYI